MPVIIKIKLIPRASENKIVGYQADDRLKIKITAPPVNGQANSALINFLSKTWGVPKTSIEIVRGYTITEKTLLLKTLDKKPILE